MRVGRALVDSLLLLLLGGLAALIWQGTRPPPDVAWDRVQAAGVLQIGTDATYPPFESIAKDPATGRDAFTGYDVDLGRTIAAQVGVRAEFVSIALDGQYDALLSGKVDLLLSALPFIYERQHEVRYSAPYYQAAPRLVVRAGEGGIAGPADLAGRRVAVELGSDADLVARGLQRDQVPTMQLLSTYHSAAEALDALRAGQADAAIADPLGLAEYANPAALRVLVAPLADEPYVAVLKPDSPRLAAAVDATIRDLRASGALARLMGEP